MTLVRNRHRTAWSLLPILIFAAIHIGFVKPTAAFSVVSRLHRPSPPSTQLIFLPKTRCRQLCASSSNEISQDKTDIPLIFLHGMKGSHLAFENKDGSRKGALTIRKKRKKPPLQQKKQRAWLTVPSLLNFPPRPDNHPARDISLPLTYGSTCGKIQDRGPLVVDGTVDHILELGPTKSPAKASLLEALPFYGHVSKHLRSLNARYNRIQAGAGEDTPLNERTSDKQGTEHPLFHIARPTRTFNYDWRRPLPELSEEFHSYCETEFPGQPVQILAHSLGGLIAFGPMTKYPDKYLSAVLVGVPFGTGIQYQQDLHRGYYTELGRCRQFTPPIQFTFSSHWAFFPLTEEDTGDTFVDVTNSADVIDFQADKSGIGAPGTTLQPTVVGDNIRIDFYNVDDWERNQIGIFDPQFRQRMSDETMSLYKNHMKIQLEAAKEWRTTVLRDEPETSSDMPDLVVCQTNTIPTLNQILRRRKTASKDHDEETSCAWEYDYISGRSVPGDGRIGKQQRVEFEFCLPSSTASHRKVILSTLQRLCEVFPPKNGHCLQRSNFTIKACKTNVLGILWR